MFYARENRTRLRSLLVDPSSLDSSTDIGQRRQGPGAGGMPHPSLLSLWPVIMDWGGRGAGLGTSCRTEPGQRKGYGRQAGCCGPELGVWGWPMAWGGVSLTCTYSYCVPRVVPTVVAVEAPVGVADRSLCAVVPQLLGTRLTALAAVGDEADAQRAAGRGRRALARPLAELGP